MTTTQHSKHLAREIELLSPAVTDDGQRPDNCEYPWEDAGAQLHVPLDWTFAPSGLLTAPAVGCRVSEGRRAWWTRERP
jgi:hypothetical protein